MPNADHREGDTLAPSPGSSARGYRPPKIKITVISDLAVSSSTRLGLPRHRLDEPFGQSPEPLQAPGDSQRVRFGVIEPSILHEPPANPALAHQDIGQGLEGVDQRLLRRRDWPGSPIRREPLLPLRFAFGTRKPFAQQPGEVAGDAVDIHRPEVDQPHDDVVSKQEMLGPRVAKAGLQWNLPPADGVNLGEDPGGDPPRLVYPTHRRESERIAGARRHGPLNRVEPAANQPSQLLTTRVEPRTWADQGARA